MGNLTPLFNDHILDEFNDGSVTPIPAIQCFVPASGESTNSDIELADGQVLKSIDAIIVCSGYHSTFDILLPRPTRHGVRSLNGKLRHIVITSNSRVSTRVSLASSSRSYSSLLTPHAPILSLRSITQIFPRRQSHASGLAISLYHPGRKWRPTVYHRTVALVHCYRIHKPGPSPLQYERWLNDAAGNQVNECLG